MDMSDDHTKQPVTISRDELYAQARTTSMSRPGAKQHSNRTTLFGPVRGCGPNLT
jgi:hypothetical protein